MHKQINIQHPSKHQGKNQHWGIQPHIARMLGLAKVPTRRSYAAVVQESLFGLLHTTSQCGLHPPQYTVQTHNPLSRSSHCTGNHLADLQELVQFCEAQLPQLALQLSLHWDEKLRKKHQIIQNRSTSRKLQKSHKKITSWCPKPPFKLRKGKAQ